MTSTRIRRPWLAALLAVFSTTVAMLYVGRGRRALAYLGGYTVCLALLGIGVLSSGSWSTTVFLAGYGGLTLAGVFDAWRIARGQREQFDGGWYSHWYGLIGVGCAAVLSILAVRTFLVEPFYIRRSGMAPTLVAGDFVLTYKLPYGNYRALGMTIGPPPGGNNPLRHGDVVIYRFPGDPSVYYVGRLIGLPKDQIRIDEHGLSINDTLIGSDLLHDGNEKTDSIDGAEPGAGESADTRHNDPPDSGDVYWADQDNERADRIGSTETGNNASTETVDRHPVDSGGIDPPDRQSANGRESGDDDRVDAESFEDRSWIVHYNRKAVRHRFEYVIPPGQYFIMGDNRDRSNDSRYWGTVPETLMVGRVVAILYSRDPAAGQSRPERVGRVP